MIDERPFSVIPLTHWIRFTPVADSTQDAVLRMARSGAPAGTVLWAGEQRRGRGRQGREWLSPAGGLYFSLLLDEASLSLLPAPDHAARLRLLPLVAGLATADAVGSEARIKWPNDVLIEGRKLAGILAEVMDSWIVLGVGINLAAAPLPTAAAMAELAAPPDPAALLDRWLARFDERLTRPDTAAEVESRLYGVGREATHAGRRVTPLGVAPDGALRVRVNGGEETISAGEVLFA